MTTPLSELASFKRSFKGKREASLKLAEYLDKKTALQSSMQSIVVDWNNTFNNPPLSLTLKRQGYQRLMWRTTQKRFETQRYIDLFGSENGEHVLSQLSKPVVDCIAQFEIKRLTANAEMKITSAAVAAIRTQITGLENIDSLSSLSL